MVAMSFERISTKRAPKPRRVANLESIVSVALAVAFMVAGAAVALMARGH
ncbi:hypothetical protein [Bradyrhizobium sp. CCGB20]|nr:hypothetical protein [Bradyrhizobium sp. CCGB20]MCP3400388.1 hypothetical protein [Bradyrhizobium sp. CCGB20]